MDDTLRLVTDTAVQFGLALLLVLVNTFGAYLVYRFRQWTELQVQNLRAQMSAEQLAVLDMGVKLAVQAAEQSGLADKAIATGAAKKTMAEKIVQSWLESRGIQFNALTISAAIERALLAGWQYPNEMHPMEATNKDTKFGLKFTPPSVAPA